MKRMRSTIMIVTLVLTAVAMVIAPLPSTHAQKGKLGSNVSPPEEYLDGATIEHPFVGTKTFAPFDAAAVDANSADWARYAHDIGNSGFSELTQINRTNAGSLKVQFIFSTGYIGGGSYQCRPLEVGGILYVNQQNGSVWALARAQRANRIPSVKRRANAEKELVVFMIGLRCADVCFFSSTSRI